MYTLSMTLPEIVKINHINEEVSEVILVTPHIEHKMMESTTFSFSFKIYVHVIIEPSGQVSTCG